MINGPTFGKMFSNVAHKLPFQAFPPKRSLNTVADRDSSVGTKDVATSREKCSFRLLHFVMLVLLKEKTCDFIVTLCMFLKGAAFPTVLQFLPSLCSFLPASYYRVKGCPRF